MIHTPNGFINFLYIFFFFFPIMKLQHSYISLIIKLLYIEIFSLLMNKVFKI